MSEEVTPAAEDAAIPTDGDAAFSQLMDFLVPEEGEEEAAAGDGAADPAAGGDGSPAAAAEGAGAAGAEPAAPAAGDAGVADVPAAEGQAAHSWTRDAAEFTSNWGEVARGLETRHQETVQAEALAEVKEEHAKYFEAIQQPPRLLVGAKVPRADGQGEEILADSQDVRDWQEAIKHVLAQEVRDRASRKADAQKPMMQTLHESLSVFQNTPELVPGAKQFDRDLLERFVSLAKPYELRVDDKLTGWSIPVQPLISQVRTQLTAERAKAPAAAAAATPTPRQERAAAQPRSEQGTWVNPDAPQAGIRSTAGGSGTEGEDMSTFWGTLGLPNLRL